MSSINTDLIKSLVSHGIPATPEQIAAVQNQIAVELGRSQAQNDDSDFRLWLETARTFALLEIATQLSQINQLHDGGELTRIADNIAQLRDKK